MDTTIAELPIIAFLYKLIVGDKWYIGSSIESIQARIGRHYRQGLETPDRKLYKTVAEVGGWKNVKVEIITTFSFMTKEDLWKEEDKYMKLDDPLCLNSNRAILTTEERINQKKEVSSRCKRTKYAKDSQDPEWKEKERARARELYNRLKQDPEWMERKRQVSLASYHRKNKKES